MWDPRHLTDMVQEYQGPLTETVSKMAPMLSALVTGTMAEP